MLELQKLKEPFCANLISWRVGATNKEKTSAIALAYIDARDVMGRLDAVCGIGGWQVEYSHADNKKTICRIGIKIKDEWIWKSNGAGDTDIEADKGAISDAFKRAAILWGIGRYLYDVANVWVDIAPAGRSWKIKNPNDPKLQTALDNAAKGIRGVNETEPAIKPVTGEEFIAMQKLIKETKTMLELKVLITGKIKAATPRLNDKQKETITSVKDKQKVALEEMPHAEEGDGRDDYK